MSNPSHIIASLLHRLGVGRRVRLGAYQGSGAPKISRLGLVLLTLTATLGTLALMTAPALAAAPETPETPETGEASAVTVTTATLEGGVLNPNAPGAAGEYQFLYRASGSQCEGESAAPEPAGIAPGIEKEVVPPVKLTGLKPGTQYTFCLLERNAAGETAVGSPVTFTTHGAGITEEQASTVEATAATLQASIDPNESNTSYHFEYDTTPYTSSAPHGTSLPVPSEGIGAGTSPVLVSVRLKGLQPGATYYYRVVAVDEIETFDGPGKTLTTPIAPGSAPGQSCPNEQLRSEQPYGLGLPDCRAYEMVSPVEKGGNDATDPGFETDQSRASVSGEAVVFTSAGSFAGPVGAQFSNQFLSRRGPDGWSTQSITPPFNEYNILPFTSPYENMAFTPELSKGVMFTEAALTSEAPAGQFETYVTNFSSGSYQWVSNVPLLPEGRECLPYRSSEYLQPLTSFAGTSTDLSHVVFYDVCNKYQLYEWIDGEVVGVSVTNSGEPMSYPLVGISVLRRIHGLPGPGL